MKSPKILFLVVVASLPFPLGSVTAQQVCNTVFDCAQKAVDAAQSASNTATALNKDMTDLKTVVQKIGTGDCKNTTAVSKFATTQAFTCPIGYYINGITFSHAGGENFTYQEYVSLSCCPVH
jgi:hypothetical protein